MDTKTSYNKLHFGKYVIQTEFPGLMVRRVGKKTFDLTTALFETRMYNELVEAESDLLIVEWICRQERIGLMFAIAQIPGIEGIKQ